MNPETASTPLVPTALLTKEPFVVQVTDNGTLKRKSLFPSLGKLSSELTTNPASSYFVDARSLHGASNNPTTQARHGVSLEQESVRKAQRKAKRNAHALLFQTLVAETGRSARSMPDRLLNDLVLVASSKIALPQEQERFKTMLQQSLAYRASQRAAEKAAGGYAHAIDFQEAPFYEEEIYVVGSLFPLLRHGIAHRIARNVVLAYWGGTAPSKMELHLEDAFQRGSVEALLIDCIRHHYVLKKQPVPDAKQLKEIWDHAHSVKCQALSVHVGGVGQIPSVENAYVRLFNGRHWYSASIHEQLPRLKRERSSVVEAVPH